MDIYTFSFPVLVGAIIISKTQYELAVSIVSFIALYFLYSNVVNMH
jgi:hypothetical protein